MGDGDAFGMRLKEVRQEKGYSQEALGVAVGKSDGTIWNWEKGSYLPDQVMVKKLEKVLERDLHNAWWEAQDDEPEPEQSAQPTGDGDDDGGEGDGLAPWDRDPDEWTACESQGPGGLGVDQVTVRESGGLYLSSPLAEAAGLGAAERVDVYTSPRGGGVEADPEGAFKLSDEGTTAGLSVAVSRLKGWTGDGSLRADVTAVGDGWFAFEKPERD